MARLPYTLVRAVVTAAVLAAALIGGPPASAASGQKGDKVGDAPAIIDIAGFTVHNDGDRAVVTLDVPGLRSRGGFAVTYGTSRFGGLYVFVRKNGPGPSVEARFCGEVRCDDVHCAGLRGTWSTDRHRIQVTIPQRCYPAALPSPGVFTATSGSRSDYDDAGALRVARG